MLIEALTLLVQNLAVLLVVMVLLWLLSIQQGDVSFIDSFWAFGFVIVAALTFATTSGSPMRSGLLLAITSVWGLRLSGYLYWRWRRDGPDGRYVAMGRRIQGNLHLGYLRKVFLLQGVLLWLVSLPVQLGALESTPRELGPLAWLGTLLAVTGIVFETIGDLQLTRFKANPTNAGRVLDTGLWRYSRHPNYFGDLCVWWGLFAIAAETGAGRFSLLGPIVLTWILAKWSGAVVLERRLHRSRAGYAEYVERTSRMIPWWPGR